MQETTEAGAEGDLLFSSFEWGTLFAFLAVVATVIYGEIQRRISRKQLTLAEELNAARPVLELTKASFLWPRSGETVENIRLVWAIRKQREMLQSEREIPSDIMRTIAVAQSQDRSKYEAAVNYDGPLPDTQLSLLLTNRGKVAASEVTGWIYFNPEHIQPLQFFGGFEEQTNIISSDDAPDLVRIKVGGNKDDTLFPSSPDGAALDQHHFTISVSIKADKLPITTPIRYEFAAPSGYSMQGETSIEIRAVHKNVENFFL
jgi:hypothetical protein